MKRGKNIVLGKTKIIRNLNKYISETVLKRSEILYPTSAGTRLD